MVCRSSVRQLVAETVEQLGISDILLALPSASRQRRHQIIEGLRSLAGTHPDAARAWRTSLLVEFRSQTFENWTLRTCSGEIRSRPTRRCWRVTWPDKVVLVTGAGGSIGSELCRQILAERPAKLLLVEHNEFGLYTIHLELEATASGEIIARPNSA